MFQLELRTMATAHVVSRQVYKRQRVRTLDIVAHANDETQAHPKVSASNDECVATTTRSDPCCVASSLNRCEMLLVVIVASCQVAAYVGLASEKERKHVAPNVIDAEHDRVIGRGRGASE